MFNWRYLGRLVGYFSLVLGVSQFLALLWSLVNLDAGLVPLFWATLVTLGLGATAVGLLRVEEHELNHREALLFVSCVWFLAGFLGGLPFWFSPNFASLTDAVFESVSGFTTTGASILTNVEAVPDSLLFWRAFTHWLGGLGIIVLMVAVLPLVGSGGMALYRAEFSGAKAEKLNPRIRQTAASFWKIYVAFTFIGIVALRVAGMNNLDAACHTFSALGTGGFSTRNASVEDFNSVAMEIILICLMVAGGMNFTQHYRLFVKRRLGTVARDTETRFYLGALSTGTLLIMLCLWLSQPFSLGHSLRLSAFQTVSIMTATGFSSADFALWHPFAQFSLLTLMWIGGSTGSTSGGIKCARIAVLCKQVLAQFRQRVHLRSIVTIRFNGENLPHKAADAALKIVCVAIVVNFTSSLLLTATGLDIVTSVSAVTSAMFSVGPGLGRVGPASNYGHLTDLAKWVLVFTMIAGRLEFFGFLVIFTPQFWKK